MIILKENGEYMEFDEYFDIRKRGYCCIAGKPLKDVKSCPIYNFDDDGKLCLPALCDEFVKLY